VRSLIHIDASPLLLQLMSCVLQRIPAAFVVRSAIVRPDLHLKSMTILGNAASFEGYLLGVGR